jgi:hypothetical protein
LRRRSNDDARVVGSENRVNRENRKGGERYIGNSQGARRKRETGTSEIIEGFSIDN